MPSYPRRILLLISSLLLGCNPSGAPLPASSEVKPTEQSVAGIFPDAAQVFNFDESAPGTPDSHWVFEATAQRGPLATWALRADPSAPSQPNALELVSVNHTSRATFNIGWHDQTQFKDGSIRLLFKANAGRVDQGGGPVWRLQDKDNYYVCRANPLEDNFRLYYVKKGIRREIASANVKIETGKWHSIRIIHNGNHIICEFNGQRLIDHTDDTFPNAGHVGVWTKADAATSFDNLQISE